MFYDNHFWGMHFIWWFIWIMVLFWIFAIPYGIPGQRYRKDSAFDILRNKLASGQLTTEEYNEKKRILDKF